MTTIDAKFRAQYSKLYSDGKISAADAKALTESAASLGAADRRSFLREKLASDAFEPAARQLIEKTVGGASGMVGTSLAKVDHGGTKNLDVKVVRDLGSPSGYATAREARDVATSSGVDAAIAQDSDGRWRAFELSAGPGVPLDTMSRAPTAHDLGHLELIPLPADPWAREKARKQVKVTGWDSGLVLVDTLKGPAMERVTTYDVDFGKPMTREQAAWFFWDQKGTPKNGAKLEPIPANASPSARWRVTLVPNRTMNEKTPGLNPFLAENLGRQARAENKRLPEWMPPRTAAAIRNKQLPPAGVTVTRPRPGIAAWEEGGGVFWYDEKKKNVQGFSKLQGQGPFVDMWNNWHRWHIMKDGMSPAEASPKVLKMIKDTNIEMVFGFAQGLASSKRPERGGALDTTVWMIDGALDATNVTDGKDDLLEAARQLRPQ